jgi:hypothetical protein
VERPWDRHVSDIYKIFLNTWLAQFHKTVGMMCPSVLASATVHTVKGAEFPVSLPADIFDVREQALIALFGDGVLNTEFGGKDIVVLAEEDHSAFNTLDTNFVPLIKKAKDAPVSVLTAIRQYSKAVQDYASKNPTTTTGAGKAKHSFSATTARMIFDQSTPKVLSDNAAILVSLGSDLGDTHEDDDSSFFEAGGRSADLVSYVYNNFGHWESGVLLASFDHGLTKRLAKDKCLPFADVFPWFVKHKDDYPKASELLAKYMRCVNPYVVLTYGTLVR